MDILADLENYKSSSATRAKWDSLHREFSCCGGLNFADGYKIWRNADIGLQSNSVPDSCCLRPSEGCGRNVFREETDLTVNRIIFTHGCVTIMEPKLNGQVVPVLLGYAGVGTVLALVQLLAVVFACAYSAAISRYEQQKDEQSQRTAVSAPSTPRLESILAYFSTLKSLNFTQNKKISRILCFKCFKLLCLKKEIEQLKIIWHLDSSRSDKHTSHRGEESAL